MNTTQSTRPNGTENETHTVRLTCDCQTCKGRAVMVTPAAARKGTAHGYVTLGYSPLGRMQRGAIPCN